jgi:hypothetical protein
MGIADTVFDIATFDADYFDGSQPVGNRISVDSTIPSPQMTVDSTITMPSVTVDGTISMPQLTVSSTIDA